MTVNLSTPVTGLAQTGLTSPTYTVAADVAPDVNGKQWAVTATGGTQTGVTTHTIASPFSWTYWKPKVNKLLGNPDPTTNVIASVPRNVHKVVTRKGVTPLTGQPIQQMLITTILEVPAGADTADSANVRAAISMHLGGLSQVSAGLGDSAVTGIP